TGSKIGASEDVVQTEQAPDPQEQHEDSERKARVEEIWKKMNSGLPNKVPKPTAHKPDSTGSTKTGKTVPDWMVALGIAPAKTPASKDTLGKRPASSQNGTNEEAKRLAAAALSAVKDVASATTAAGSGKVEVCSDLLKQSSLFYSICAFSLVS
ncbi:hypothetical protein BHE74_00031988, partial [Ensete ventricosum]